MWFKDIRLLKTYKMASVFNSQTDTYNLDDKQGTFLGKWEDIQAYTSVINTIETGTDTSGTIHFEWVNKDDDSVPTDQTDPLCVDSYNFGENESALTKQFDTRARWFRLKIEGNGTDIKQFATTYKKSATEIKLTDDTTNIVSVNVGDDNENSLFTVLTDMSGDLLGTTNDAHPEGEALFTHLADASGHSLSTTDTYRSLHRKLAPSTGWRPDRFDRTNLHNGDGTDGLTTSRTRDEYPVSYLRADFTGITLDKFGRVSDNGRSQRYSDTQDLPNFTFTTVSANDMPMSIAVANGENGLSGVYPETRSTRDTRVTLKNETPGQLSKVARGLLVGDGDHFDISLISSSTPNSSHESTIKITNEGGSSPTDLSNGYLFDSDSYNLVNTDKVAVSKFSGRQGFTVRTVNENDVLRDGLLQPKLDTSLKADQVIVLQASDSNFTTDYTLFNHEQMRPHVGKSVILTDGANEVDNFIVKELEIDTSMNAKTLDAVPVDFSLHAGTYIAIGTNCNLTDNKTDISLHFEDRMVFDVCGINHGTPTTPTDISLESLTDDQVKFLRNITGPADNAAPNTPDFSFAKVYGLGQYYLEPQQRATNKYYNNTIGDWTTVNYTVCGEAEETITVEFNDTTVGVQHVSVGRNDGNPINYDEKYLSMQSPFKLRNRQAEEITADPQSLTMERKRPLMVIEDQNTFILPKSVIPFKHGDIVRMAVVEDNDESLLENIDYADGSGYLKVTGRAHFAKTVDDNVHFNLMVDKDIGKWFTDDSNLSGPTYRSNDSEATPNKTILPHASNDSNNDGVSLELADFFKPIDPAVQAGNYRFDDTTLYDTSYIVLDMTVSFGGSGFTQGTQYNGRIPNKDAAYDIDFTVESIGSDGNIIDVRGPFTTGGGNAVFKIGDVIEVSPSPVDGSNAQLIVSKVAGPDDPLDFPTMDKYHSIIKNYWSTYNNSNVITIPPTGSQGYPLDLRFYKPLLNKHVAHNNFTIQFDVSTTNGGVEGPSESLAVALRDGHNNTFKSTGAGHPDGVPPTVYEPLSISGGRAAPRKILYLLETNYASTPAEATNEVIHHFNAITVSLNKRLGTNQTATLVFNGTTNGANTDENDTTAVLLD